MSSQEEIFFKRLSLTFDPVKEGLFFDKNQLSNQKFPFNNKKS